MSRTFVMVTITCGTADEADRLARALVEARLAACVQSMPVSSCYRWQGEVEQATEVLLVAKTAQDLLPAIETVVGALHAYDVPEMVATPIAWTSRPYGAWLGENLCPAEAGDAIAGAISAANRPSSG